MDKQTVIGIILIIGIFIGFSYINKPSKDEIARQKIVNDSIKNAQKALQITDQQATNVAATQDSVSVESDDSIKKVQLGLFANVAQGDTTPLTIETELLKLKISPKGGNIFYAELKKYKTHSKKPLILFKNREENSLDFLFQTSDNRVLTTQDMIFSPLPVQVDKDSNSIITMRLNASSESYLDFIYKIPKNNYYIDFDIVAHNMQKYFAPMTNKLDFTWHTKIRQQEGGRKFENRYATLNYMHEDNDIERLSDSKNDGKNISTPIMWFAAKDQFFSTVLLSKSNFSNASLKSDNYSDDKSEYLKAYTINSEVNFDATGQKPTNLKIFLVPNQYKILNAFNDEETSQKPNLQRLIPLGLALFRWISVYAIIPLFNLFGSFLSNWGLIILIVTIIIKVVLLPLTFKSYMSTAKMKVLKPQLDAIHEKIPADKIMERQQAQMKLYRSVGVSSMGGCLPMLLQMPILVAVFMYLPSAIELRQQSFLWAQDLSTFDSVPFLSWDTPIPFLGTHISIFCLLMTVTNIIYTKINMATTMGGNQQMAMMKWMMYLMPLFLFFMFNDYSAGLTYYYFISLLLTILQTYLFRLFVDEDKLLQKLELAKQTKKPAKTSGFMARLEEAQKMQQKRMREKTSRSKK